MLTWKGVCGMSKRRDFLKTTGAALGGIAISGITSITAEAEPQRTAEVAQRARKPGRISIHCTPNVKIESIHEAIKQALGRVGCPACGLLGIDLHIGGDPEPFAGIKAPGVSGASFTPLG